MLKTLGLSQPTCMTKHSFLAIRWLPNWPGKVMAYFRVFIPLQSDAPFHLLNHFTNYGAKFELCIFLLLLLFFWDRISLCRPGSILAHCNLQLLISSNFHASAFQVAKITGTHHHAQLLFVFLVEMGFHHVGQAGLELMTSGNSPASVSKSGITGVSHHTWPLCNIFIDLNLY